MSSRMSPQRPGKTRVRAVEFIKGESSARTLPYYPSPNTNVIVSMQSMSQLKSCCYVSTLFLRILYRTAPPTPENQLQIPAVV